MAVVIVNLGRTEFYFWSRLNQTLTRSRISFVNEGPRPSATRAKLK